MFLVVLAYGEIFKTDWQGIYVQEFFPYGCIISIEAYGPDSLGNVYLRAISESGDSASIFRARWQGIRVQSFNPHRCIRGFSAVPDTGGWITLYAYTADSSIVDSGAILSTKWKRTFLQSFDAGSCYIGGFSASFDTTGFVYLSVDTICVTPVSENVPSRFRVAVEHGGEGIKLVIWVPEHGRVNLRIFDPTGRLIRNRELVLEAGRYIGSIKTNVSGVYVVNVRYKGEEKTLKVVVPKRR